MAETNGDVKKCPHCHILENKLHECSEMLRIERIERGEREAFGDYEELLNRFATVYRDMDSGAEIRARINLLPMQAKIAETKAFFKETKMKKKDYPLSATITAGEAKIVSNLTVENLPWHRRWRKKMKPAISESLKIVAKQLLTEGVKKVFDFFFQRFRTKSLHRLKT